MSRNNTARLADQIVAAAYSAGFRGQALIDWTAIALAESRGNINAQGDQTLTNRTWGNSVGLWQVRSMNAHRGKWNGSSRVRDATRLTDPMINARAAWVISNGGRNKRPWSVTHGKANSYRNFIGVARQAVGRTTSRGGSQLNSAGNRVLRNIRAQRYVGGVARSQGGGRAPLTNAAQSGNLRMGSRGARVRDLQRRLNSRGGISVKVDGIFGAQTRDALRRFQRRSKLLVDGVAGARTFSALGMAAGTSGWENRVGGVQRKTTTKKKPTATSGWENRVGGTQNRAAPTIPGAGPNPTSGDGGWAGDAGWADGGGGGGGGVPDSGPGSGKPLSAKELRDYIAETYPQMLWALRDKELGPLLKKAAEEGWSAGRMYGQLIKTDWWKKNPESARALQQIRHNDPKTWSQMLGQKQAEIAALARQIGIPVSSSRFRQMRETALLQNWTEEQTREQLLRNWRPRIADLRDGKVGGQAGQIWKAIESLPSEYLQALPARDMVNWVVDITSGKRTVESFQSYLSSTAAANMPFLQEFLKQGLTPRQALAPHRAQVAQVLEVDEETVDFGNARWQKLLTDEAGKLASSQQIRQHARVQMPTQWDKTAQARSSAMQMVQGLAETFGTRA